MSFVPVNNNLYVKCECCNSEYLTNDFLFYKIQIDVKNKKTKIFTKIYKNSYLFRASEVPGIHNYKRSKSNNGRSKNGLIFASYKRSFDEQLLSDECGEIKFKHRHSEKVYLDSGMDSYDRSVRYVDKRSWKRSKKRKQWM